MQNLLLSLSPLRLALIVVILLSSCAKKNPTGPVVPIDNDTIPPVPMAQIGDVNPDYKGNVADYFKTPRVLYTMSGDFLVYFPGGGIRVPFISSDEYFRVDVMNLYKRRQLERGEPIDSTLQYRDIVMHRIFRMSDGYPWTWGVNSLERIEYLKTIGNHPSYVKGFNGGQMAQMDDGTIVFRRGEETDPWFPDELSVGTFPSGNFVGDRRWYFSQQEVSGNQMKLRGDSAVENNGWVSKDPWGGFRSPAYDAYGILDNWNNYRLIVESDSLAFLLVMHPHKVNSKEPWKDSHEVLIVLPNPYPKKPD